MLELRSRKSKNGNETQRGLLLGVLGFDFLVFPVFRNSTFDFKLGSQAATSHAVDVFARRAVAGIYLERQTYLFCCTSEKYCLNGERRW